MALESLKATCKTCLRLLSNYLVLGGILLLVLGVVSRSSIERWLTGQITMIAAWIEFQANVAGFLDNPIVRLGFIFLALWMFGKAARDISNKDAARQVEETATRQAAIDKVTVELERRQGPYDALVKMYLLQAQYDKLQEIEGRTSDSLSAARDTITDFRTSYVADSDNGDTLRGWQRSMSGHFEGVRVCREMIGLDGSWDANSLEADPIERMEKIYFAACEAFKPVAKETESLRHQIAALRSKVK